MPQAEEIQVVTPNLCVWGAYATDLKCDLTSAAYVHQGSMVLIDPIALADEAWKDLLKLGAPRAVLLTNGNHLRDAAHFRQLCGIPVVGSVGTREEIGKDVDVVLLGHEVIHGLMSISIPGAGAGETAFLSEDGILMIGDAVVNLGGELALLPDKYAIDAKQNRESLSKLIDLNFNIMTFAHGLPVTQGAKERLKGLIG